MFYMYLLYSNLKYINPPDNAVVRAEEMHIVSASIIQLEKLKLRDTYEEVDHIKFLYESYTPSAWYFEVIECFRRLCLTAIPSLILPNTAVQNIILLITSLGFSAIYAEIRPFTLESDSNVAVISQWGISFTLIFVLILRVGLDEGTIHNKFGEDFLGYLIVGTNIFVILISSYLSLYNKDNLHSNALESFNKSQEEKHRPMIRNSNTETLFQRVKRLSGIKRLSGVSLIAANSVNSSSNSSTNNKSSRDIELAVTDSSGGNKWRNSSSIQRDSDDSDDEFEDNLDRESIIRSARKNRNIRL